MSDGVALGFHRGLDSFDTRQLGELHSTISHSFPLNGHSQLADSNRTFPLVAPCENIVPADLPGATPLRDVFHNPQVKPRFEPNQPIIADVQPIIVKIGTEQVLNVTKLDGRDNVEINTNTIEQVVEAAANLRRYGSSLLVVASGAIKFGDFLQREQGNVDFTSRTYAQVKEDKNLKELAHKTGHEAQAAKWDEVASAFGMSVVYILVDKNSVVLDQETGKVRYTPATQERIRSAMLDGKLIVVNGLDHTVFEEQKKNPNDPIVKAVTDNDAGTEPLAAALAGRLGGIVYLSAGSLGVYDENSAVVEELDANAVSPALWQHLEQGGKSSSGSGGMYSKVEKATSAGVDTIITPAQVSIDADGNAIRPHLRGQVPAVRTENVVLGAIMRLVTPVEQIEAERQQAAEIVAAGGVSLSGGNLMPRNVGTHIRTVMPSTPRVAEENWLNGNGVVYFDSRLTEGAFK